MLSNEILAEYKSLVKAGVGKNEAALLLLATVMDRGLKMLGEDPSFELKQQQSGEDYRFTMGKYLGEKPSDVPAIYLNWVVNNVVDNPVMVAECRKALNH